MLLFIFTTVVAVYFLRYFIRNNFSFGEDIILFLKNVLHLRDNVAAVLYRFIFYNNIDVITLIVILIFLVIFFRFSISWFTRYFEEVSIGMDKLVEESDEEITLSPELDFMENKLNQIISGLRKTRRSGKGPIIPMSKHKPNKDAGWRSAKRSFK